MADAKEVLEMFREVAKLRISMLKDGVTYHDQAKRDYYLGEYEKKLHDIERLIRRYTLRVIPGKKSDPPAEPSP